MTRSLFIKMHCLVGFFVLLIGLDSGLVSPATAAENLAGVNKRATVKSVPISKTVQISRRIDELVSAKLDADDQSINPQSTDEVFVRRVYLDIVGRIPTLAETNSFLEKSSRNKRADLIDELLDSYGYVSRQFNFWADLLRIQTRQPGNLSGEPYINFVKDALQQNLPYDQFVRQLVTAEGGNMERGKGAVGYYLRDRNMPEDNMSNTIRVFLGTRLECAQCHDHPFDKWTQRQYFEMVAFTGGIEYRIKESQQKFQSLRKQKSNLTEHQYKVLQRMSQFASHGITGSGIGLARLPEGYEGSEGEAGEIVSGKTMFTGEPLIDVEIPAAPKKSKNKKRKNKPGVAIRGAKAIGSRTAYGQWLANSDNPRFATVIANRLWKQALGLGLIEPVDVIEDSTVPSNPALMEYLTETMIELDFDMKQFLRAVYNSRTYQATAFESDVLNAQEFGFNGPVVRRFSAEQIWDSLLVLTTNDIDHRFQPAETTLPGFTSNPADAYEKISQMNTTQVKKYIDELVQLDRKQMKNKRKKPNSAELEKLKTDRQRLTKKIRNAQRSKNMERERELSIQLADINLAFRKKAAGRNSRFLRASELRSPSPVGHFLREFGQSDRETIDNSNTDPAVTQVLSMMNGYIEQAICRDSSSQLMQSVMATTNAAECTETVFLSMLNRRPSRAELRVWEPEFKSAMRERDRKKIKDTYSDLIWTLANSNEFIFIK